jgi:hypothetical protein
MPHGAILASYGEIASRLRQHGLKSLARRLVPADLLQRMKQFLLTWNTAKVQMPEDVRGRLVSHYHDNIRGLESLINRDLCGWLQ